MTRISEPFPATVRGIDRAGKRFEIDGTLDNLSAGGLYIRLPRAVSERTELSVLVRLTTAPPERVVGPRVSARGVVLRSEPHADGECGVALRFTRYRLL